MRLFAGNKTAAIAEVFPDAAYQRCTVHFYRNVMVKVPRPKRRQVIVMLKTIHAQESFDASKEKAESVALTLEEMRLKETAKCVRDDVIETLAYIRFPVEHWRRIRTDNAIERLNREIRRRTRIAPAPFPMAKARLCS